MPPAPPPPSITQAEVQSQSQSHLQPLLLLPSITLTDPENEEQPTSPTWSPQTPVKHNGAGSVKSGVAGVVAIAGRWTGVPDKPANDGAESAVPRSLAGSSEATQSTWRRANETIIATGTGVHASTEKQRKFRASLSNVALSSQNNSHSSVSINRGSPLVEPDAARNEHLKHAIDPLSSHIIKRTSASPLASQHTRNPSVTSDTSSMRPPDDGRSIRTRSPSRKRQDRSNERTRDELKRGVKAVSFISRLIRNKSSKGTEEKVLDTDSIVSDAQLEGNEAEVFSQSSDPSGFDLRSTRPPPYIKTRSKYKEKSREFDRMFLAQELVCGKRRRLVRTNSNRLLRRKSSGSADADTVWAMEFSRDGRYLAAGGADGVVRVWKVLASHEDRKAHELQESHPTNGAPKHSGAPVFQSEPLREYNGHEAPVLDLSWSTNGFLLSSSMDKTVRLWHMSRAECICTFRHNDFVPSIAFHPKDDRYFLTGSLDARLRLWSVDSKSVVCSVKVPDMITAVAFMPDGKCAVAGTLNGSCLWYDTDDFSYKTQLQIRPDRGQGVQGPKITGISSAFGRGGEKLIITSNDSKIRLYNVRDKGCEIIFKGNVNDSSQIRASLSDDGRYVACGSEDRRAYIWSVTPTENGKLDRRPVDYFDAHDSVTTVVRIAPTRTRRLLDQSEDPVYDLCNAQLPSVPRTGRRESYSSMKPAIEHLTRIDSHDGSESLRRSASLRARSAHKDGNIIVTADYAGTIKVFRQDCAWHRRQRDDGERSSLFRRSDRSSMTSSLQTKSSQRSLRDAKNAAMAQVASSDRINHWRQDIAGTPSTTQQQSPQIKPESRPASPRNIESQASQAGSADTTGGSPSTLPTSTTSAEQPTIMLNGSVESGKDAIDKERKDSGDVKDPLFLDGQRSYMFWDKTQWQESSDRAKLAFAQSEADAQAAAQEMAHKDGLAVQMPRLGHSISNVSRLSDELSNTAAENSDEDGDDHFDDAVEHHQDHR